MEQEQPYGAGDFGETLVRAGFECDTRGRSLGITAQRVMAAPDGFGGGLVAQLIGTPMAMGASIAQGTEGVRFYFSGGFSF